VHESFIGGEGMKPALIVMYHYVWPDGEKIPGGIRPLLVSEFERQLDWLSERYEIVGAEEFIDAMLGERNQAFQKYSSGNLGGSKPPCLLTFDDGTKDHASIVTPILAARGLTGVFFVLSGPAEHGTMPLTHAIHWLLGGDERLVWELLQRHTKDWVGDPAEAERIYYYESPIRARIKYAANMAVPVDVTERIVQAAVAASGRTMKDLAEEWFVSAEEIRAMDAKGMTIAMHGCTHRSLQSLGAAGIQEEIHHCSEYLSDLIGQRPTWYACPFGGSGAPPQSVSAMRNAMAEVGVVASVSTEKKYVETGCDLLVLPRLDTVDLPPRSKLSIPLPSANFQR
jgi:peptidoglycan/xylan/chitin deacetylase (PgdA/CDA1 family)